MRRSPIRLGAARAAFFAAACAVAPARAQETQPGVVRGGRVLADNQTLPPLDPNPPLGILPTSEDPLIDPRMTRSWGKLPPRLFLSSTVDLGYLYARPRLSFGYGKPFTTWLGVEANPIAQLSGLGAYGGARFEVPYADLRVGVRYFSSFTHVYLERQPSYERLELETHSGDKARTLTYEAEIDAGIPVGPGKVLLRGSISYVSGVPEDHDVFEETLHVIVAPPLVWRGRVGYGFVLGKYGQHSLGFVVDLLHVPKREDSETWRVGPVLRLGLSRRVELRGSFVVPFVGPDDIGLVGGDFTELGVRYRWATE